MSCLATSIVHISHTFPPFFTGSGRRKPAAACEKGKEVVGPKVQVAKRRFPPNKLAGEPGELA